MRQALSVLLGLLFSVSSFGQNWRTVNPQDTVYFSSEHALWPASSNDYNGHYLRVVFIDSVHSSAGDSSFYFFKSTRFAATNGACVDTAAPSWLGAQMIRKSDGTELYQNVFGDTITIDTKAALGDSWLLAKDTAGLDFIGAVTAWGTGMVNGVSDSVKTISIQAYQNGLPVVHSYNNRVLELSKNHGWIKTLDLYQFPNILQMPVYGAVYDSTQHSRLDKDYFDVSLDTAFEDWYATTPGNEWIHTTENNYPSDKLVTDSLIIGRQVLSSTVVVVTAKVTTYQLSFTLASGGGGYVSSSSVTTHNSVDTVVLANKEFHLMPVPVLPEARNAELRYMVGSFCNDKFRFIAHAVVQPGSVVWPAGGCLRFMQGQTGLFASEEMTMSPVGEASYYEESTHGPAGQGGISYLDNRYYNYIKIDTCVWGQKIDVANLGVAQTTLVQTIKVAPNPATDIVHIDVPDASVQLTVYDMMGRVVHKASLVAGSNAMSVRDMPPGLYLLCFSGSSGSYTYKLIKN